MSDNAGAVLDADWFCRVLKVSIEQALRLPGVCRYSLADCDSDVRHQLLRTKVLTTCRERVDSHGPGKQSSTCMQPSLN